MEKLITVPETDGCKGCCFKEDYTGSRCRNGNQTINGVTFRCTSNKIIYKVNTDPIPKLEVGMVVEYSDRGFYIVLPDDGSIGLYSPKGYNVYNYNTDKITKVYKRRTNKNYYGFFSCTFDETYSFELIWEKKVSKNEKKIEELKNTLSKMEEEYKTSVEDIKNQLEEL